MRSIPLLRFLGLALFFPVAVLAADPVAELAKFSVFGTVSLPQLAKGEIKTGQGTPLSTGRFLAVQSCSVVPNPPAKVLATMRQFDPTAYKELKVYLHTDLPAAPTVADFSKLNNPPHNSAVEALAAATRKMSTDLQISRAEAQRYSQGQPVFAFWSDLLAKRAQDFVAGGVARVAPYDYTRDSVQPGREFAELMREQGNVSRQFGGFLAKTGLFGGKGSIKPDLYWELLQAEDNGVVTLGASYSQPTPDGGVQVADGLYYASGGYNVVLTLFQLWPVTIDGRASTLIWRGNFISARAVGDLHGIARLAAESAMKQDILRAVTLFQRDASR
jgi:hypothetical protein